MFTAPSGATNLILFEGNGIGFGGETSESDQIGGSGSTLSTSYNIIRINTFYNNLIYDLVLKVYPDMVSSYNHIYNNTFYHEGYSTTGPNKVNSDDEYTHAIYGS